MCDLHICFTQQVLRCGGARAPRVLSVVIRGFRYLSGDFVNVTEQGWRLEAGVTSPAVFYPPPMGSSSGQGLALASATLPTTSRGHGWELRKVSSVALALSSTSPGQSISLSVFGY